MRAIARRSLFLVPVVLAMGTAVAATWALSLPPQTHLRYAVLPIDGQNFVARSLIWVSQQALRRLHECPVDETAPETPIGFIVSAVRDESDRGWFLPALESLTRAGCDVNAYSKAGLTPLMGAALQKQEWAMALLVERGALVGLRAKGDGWLVGLTAAEISERAK